MPGGLYSAAIPLPNQQLIYVPVTYQDFKLEQYRLAPEASKRDP